MNKKQIEAQVLRDYEAFAGKVARVKSLVYYKDCHSFDLDCPEGALVKVVAKQQPGEIIVWNEDYCDPVWVVEAVDVPGLPKDHSTCWVHGISYQEGHGKTPENHPELVEKRN